ncbi:MAG: 3-dehydroquinate synthase [Clostridiales bacterium]|jgi:3-dehydroquinate synthase|nr:3-dehydroquinate synthase [Clostridiales bacterium]
MITVKVEASKSYDVIIAPDILSKAGTYIMNTCQGEKAAIVTDTNVDALYSGIVEEGLKSSGYLVHKFVIESGEKSKNADNYISLLNFLAEKELNRSDVVVALGGGVVGDLAGFAAATYMRGIALVQLPTTLLAAVDSSVGGKTAIDLKAGKNLAGAFYQPCLVLCDYKTLESLSPEGFRDGCAEIIKYGMITDPGLLDMLKKPLRPQLEEVISRCVSIKRDIVMLDERDTGRRRLLNFGHTIGHALEALSGYRISHGNAVSAGMVLITRAWVRKGMCGRNVLEELTGLADIFRLAKETDFDTEAIYNSALADKKRAGDYLSLVVPEARGRCEVKETPLEEFRELIELGLQKQY